MFKSHLLTSALLFRFIECLLQFIYFLTDGEKIPQAVIHFASFALSYLVLYFDLETEQLILLAKKFVPKKWWATKKILVEKNVGQTKFTISQYRNIAILQYYNITISQY